MNNNKRALSDRIISREQVIEELVQWAYLDPQTTRSMWESEERCLGTSVNADARRFGVIPHVHDSAMEKLYQEGVGFVFETLCYWLREDRQAWSQRGVAKLDAYCNANGIDRSELKLLMLGDGSGSDTLYLISKGYRPSYYDIPDSITSRFARFRFELHDVTSTLNIVENYQALLQGSFDALWCFDVLEHLPDLPQAISDMSKMLRTTGLALITESCKHVRPDLPTHLQKNLRYHGHIPEIMQRNGLYMISGDPVTDFRPTEYQKLHCLSWRKKRAASKRAKEAKIHMIGSLP